MIGVDDAVDVAGGVKQPAPKPIIVKTSNTIVIIRKYFFITI
jgi:hypothetical protein